MKSTKLDGAKSMNQSLPNEEQIFRIARVIPSAAERSEYLKQVCGDDTRLFERMVALLKTTDEENSFLENPPDALAATRGVPFSGTVSEKPGKEIGPYKLLQQIGEGGFGVVYMAEQLRPVKRKVALKIIKPGMDSKEVIARFEAERQALALMNHPNIAKVFDGGTTDSGRPYFVMELVKGVPLTEFCDQNRLTTQQRLDLFAKVCKAIQHAHQKGIIHRDIKPSNVMVTLNDNQPVPKVIDFGVAKAISQELTEKTMFTTYGQMIGTPQYMSPEQAQMSGLDIDTRSDVYSLGVLLYELLTGKTPLDINQLRHTAYAEMQRLICEVEPPKPSTKVSALGDASLKIAQSRGTDANKLNLLLRGDLDWIVMTALDKDRNRRYESAGNFAGDIERYLADQPIQARPPSVGYKLQKFMRRNQARIYGWAGAAALILIAGLAIAYAWTAGEKHRQLIVDNDIKTNEIKQKLTSTKQQLVGQAIDTALDTIFNTMDPIEAEKAVTYAQSVGASGADLEILKGRLELLRDQPQKAISHFETAIELNPRSAAPRANLVTACVGARMRSKVVKLTEKLEQFVPKSADDYLFMAEALIAAGNIYGSKDLGLKMINQSIGKKDNSRARLIRARAYTNFAIDTLHAPYLDLAFKDIDAASTFAKDEQPILRARLHTSLLAMYVYRAIDDRPNSQLYYEQAKNLIKTQKSRGYKVSPLHRLMLVEFPQTPESDAKAIQLLEETAEDFEGGFGILALYALGQSQTEARRVLKLIREKNLGAELDLCGLGILAAGLCEMELAEECFDRLNQQGRSKDARLNAMFISALVHDESDFKKKCQEIVADLGSLPNENFDLVPGIVMGTVDQEEVIDATKLELSLRVPQLCLLALVALSDGKIEQARSLFKATTEKGFPNIDERCARSILRRLDENPNWFDEIRKSRKRER